MYKEFVTPLHIRASRDYVGRVTEFDKGECAEIAKQYGYEYWDGPRQYGYGGYKYDGRWKQVAEAMINEYKIDDGASILDIGCGKGFLLYEFTQLLPNCKVTGLDISSYALENSKEEIKDSLVLGHAKKLPFKDNSFDLIITNTTFHNLKVFEIFNAIREVERVKKEGGNSWICVESFRNEKERANLLYWQLTCESFYSTDEWEWIYKESGYTGDHEFIFFE